jgi:hypothetical protein
VAVALNKLADFLMVFSLRVNHLTLFSVQFEVRCDGPQLYLDCLSTNLLFASRNASGSHMLGETDQHINFF